MSSPEVPGAPASVRPTMMVVAGPAGSGKSTVFPLASFGVDSFSVDDRCAELNDGAYTGIPAAVRARAGAECQSFIEEHIASKASFAVETTLRTQIAIEQAITAKGAGFRTIMLFITTEDVRINIARIAARGFLGGHSSGAEEIRRIYDASMANLPHAIAAFHRVMCFDNTAHSQRPARVLSYEDDRLVKRATVVPRWATALEARSAPR